MSIYTLESGALYSTAGRQAGKPKKVPVAGARGNTYRSVDNTCRD